MDRVQKSVEVDVPVNTAYNQWTQFEEFPRFMEGVKAVKQLDDTRLHWVAEIAGQEREWDAEITEQVPDQRIVWQSEGGVQNMGVVTFQPVNGNKTLVRLELDWEPESLVEEVGDKLQFVSRRVEGDLERFKEFIEARGQETGAWRGTVR